MVAGKIGGEIAALDGGVRTATWIAVEPTTVFAIARTDLLELMAQRPEFTHHMVEVFCQRVRNTSQQVEDAAFLSVPERLARQILSMDGRHLRAESALSNTNLATRAGGLSQCLSASSDRMLTGVATVAVY